MRTDATVAIYSFLLFIISFGGCQEIKKKEYTLHIKGSESMHEAFDALKTDFESMQDTLKLTIEGGGSKTGLIAIKNGEAEIGLSSFPFDLDSVFGANHGVRELVVAYDGIVIINNKRNPVQQLSNEQIADIFSGAVSDWSQLGGSPGQIIPIIRDQNSGTQKFFTEYFGVEEVAGSALIAGENAEIVAKVKSLESGIGFIGFAYFTESINNVLLHAVGSDSFIPPTFQHMHNGSYPLKRSLQIYYREEHSPAVRAFLNYLSTPSAQSVLEMNGLIPKGKML